MKPVAYTQVNLYAHLTNRFFLLLRDCLLGLRRCLRRKTAGNFHFHNLVPYFLVPFLGQVVGDVVPVTERLDALPSGIGLTLVTDEKPFKIFTAIHLQSFNVYSTKVATSNGMGNMSVLDAYQEFSKKHPSSFRIHVNPLIILKL